MSPRADAEKTADAINRLIKALNELEIRVARVEEELRLLDPMEKF